MASGSPRRKQLLSQILDEFDIAVATLPEVTDKTQPQEIVMDLSRHKAKEVADKNQDAIVIGADTIVVLDGVVLGKPSSSDNAVEMLIKLSGREHFVYTGVTIISDNVADTFFVKSVVEFFALTRKQIEDYVATGSPMDKAGAYGIQDSGFVKNIVGSYSCVMGFPLEQVKARLSEVRR